MAVKVLRARVHSSRTTSTSAALRKTFNVVLLISKRPSGTSGRHSTSSSSVLRRCRRNSITSAPDALGRIAQLQVVGKFQIPCFLWVRACNTGRMPKRLSRHRKSDDPAQSAFRVLQHVIDVTEGPRKPARKNVIPMTRRKNPAAVALGRKGGQKSAAGRMKKIAPEERHRIASEAAQARWAKKKADG